MPQNIFPFNKWQTPPNIFFSSLSFHGDITFLIRASISLSYAMGSLLRPVSFCTTLTPILPPGKEFMIDGPKSNRRNDNKEHTLQFRLPVGL